MTTKLEYIERLAVSIREWDAKIDELAAKSEGGPGEEKMVYKRRLAELRERRHEAVALLSSLHEADEAAWPGIRKEADHVVEEVNKSLKGAA